MLAFSAVVGLLFLLIVVGSRKTIHQYLSAGDYARLVFFMLLLVVFGGAVISVSFRVVRLVHAADEALESLG